MRKQKTIAAVAMTAALAGGALVGSTLGNPLASGAQETPTTTAPGGTEQGSADAGAPDRGPGRRGGIDLEVAAETLGLTTEELRTQLRDGKSLAQVAEAEGVDKQELIDALVAAGEERLEEAKASLPERVAEAVESTHTPGEHGPGRGPGIRGARIEAAAEVLGVSEDDLRTALRDGTTLAEVAEEKGVDVQDVIDALVADAKTRIAEAVTDGKITQEQADERLESLTDHITRLVEEGFPKGRPDGPPPAEGDDGGN